MKTVTVGTQIEAYDQVYEEEGLRKISEVVLDNVQVQPISP